MRILIMAGIASVAWTATACAQELPGSYRYDGPNGSAVLILKQESPSRVAGTMQMSNGTTFTVSGQVENGRAVGDVTIGEERGFFAAGFQGSTLLVVVAERDAATGQPRLDSGWSLEFTRSDGAPAGASPLGPGASAMIGQAPAASSPAAAPPERTEAAAAGAFAQTDRSPTAQAWLQKLRGKRITYMSSYTSSPSGGSDGYISGGGYSDRFDAYLCSDGQFLYRSKSSMTVDAGAFGSSSSRNGLTGRWRIITQGQEAAIEYRTTDGQQDYVRLGFQDGKTYWDGKRVFVTNENDVCS